MKRSLSVFLASAGLAAVLAAVLACRSPRPGGEGTEGGSGFLLPGLPDSCGELTIRNDSLDASLRKIAGTWRIERPVRDRADSEAVQEILGALRSARALRIVEVGSTGRAAFGLDPPRAEIVIGGRALRVGGVNAAGDGVYAMRPPSDDVLLTDAWLAPFAGVPLRVLRDRRAIAFPAVSIRRLVVERGDTTWTVDRVGQNRWIEEEFGLRADGASVGAVLDFLQKTRVHSYQDSLPFEDGSERLAFRVQWEGGEAQIRIGAGVPGTSLLQCLADDREAPFRIARHQADSLLTRSLALVDRRVFSPGVLDAERVTLRGAASSFELVRKAEGAWSIDVGEVLPAFAPQTRAFLRNLENLRALRFLPQDALGFPDSGGWNVSVDAETVRIAEAGDVLVAQREGEKGLLVLDPGVRRLLETASGDLLAPARSVAPAVPPGG